jgi:excisionase family DNA binding protein
VPIADKLGVRAAAEALGVHENTLRRWERKGLIRAIKLPTGVRRFRREDVERLRKEMWDDVLEETRSEPHDSERKSA